MTTPALTKHLVELIRRTSTDLPKDVEEALEWARDVEREGSPARHALSVILRNVCAARQSSTPLCQDTGTPLFYVDHPCGWSTTALTEHIRAAVAIATRQALLRPNAVDSVSGKNSGDNLGFGLPSISFNEWSQGCLRVRLLLKGGGSENVSTQYSLPDASLNAARDLDGVRRAVLDAVQAAQGQGCAPGIVGVCIGGDRSEGYVESKRQLLRPLTDTNPDARLASLEKRILSEANSLGIGPMGFGGRVTLLAVKIGFRHRLPASFFVTVSYMCWACRRHQITYQDGRPDYA